MRLSRAKFGGLARRCFLLAKRLHSKNRIKVFTAWYLFIIYSSISYLVLHNRVLNPAADNLLIVVLVAALLAVRLRSWGVRTAVDDCCGMYMY